MDNYNELLRHSISALLAGTSENNHLKVDIVLEPEGTFGLSTLQMPRVEEIWQHETEGIIMLKMQGEEEPVELEDYEDCMKQIYSYLEQHKYDNLSDEQLKEIFEDWEADNVIEEYKSGLRE